MVDIVHSLEDGLSLLLSEVKQYVMGEHQTSLNMLLLLHILPRRRSQAVILRWREKMLDDTGPRVLFVRK